MATDRSGTADCAAAKDFGGVTHLCTKPANHTGAHTSGSASWGAHEWVVNDLRWPNVTRDLPVCVRCGVVRRHDGLNKPCREKLAPITLRADEWTPDRLAETPDQQRIAEIRQREQAATKGPWYVRICQWAGEDEACAVQATPPAPTGGSYVDIFCDASYDECHHVVNRDDADFIAHARADIPWLLARLATVEQALRELTAACERDFTGPNTRDCRDDESVASGETMAITFGMIRRARKALAPSASADGEQP